MAPEFSKMVLVQMNQALELICAAQTHQPRIIGQMIERLKPLMGDIDVETFTFHVNKLVELHLKYLQQVTQDMGDADLAHNQGLLQTQQARDHRDAILKETFKQLVSVKQFIEGFYGKECLESLGMAGETPRVPGDLEGWLENAICVLTQGDFQLPPARLPAHSHWNVGTISTHLIPIHAALRDALERVRLAQAQDARTLECKRQHMEKHSQIYNAVACMLESHAYSSCDPEMIKLFCSRQTRRSNSPKNANPTKNTEAQDTIGLPN